MAAARNDPTTARGAGGPHWTSRIIFRLAFGILTAVLGALVVFWPGHPVPLVSVLFGVQLILSAVFRFISAIGTGGRQWMRAVNLVAGVIALIAGLFFLRHPYSLGSGTLVLGLVLGIYWVVTGAIDLFTVITQSHLPRRGMTALTAILSLVVGIIVLVEPSVSMTLIAWVLGGFLLVVGVITIVQALLLRQQPARTGEGSPAR